MMFKKYDNYKDSGLEWLGEIPKQWKFYRIDWINKIVRGNTGFKKDELLDNGEYIALQYGKTYKVDEINETFRFYVNNEFYKSNQTVHYGDTILISTSETIEDLRHSCFYNRNNIGLIGGEQILLKPNSKFIFDKYLYYYSKIFFNGLSKYATGLKVFRFNIDDLKNIVLWLPNIAEQNQIATYLDTQTQKIDKEIQLLEEKSLKYKELKQTLINETVLRGLEWIGDIPSRWEVKRLKDLGFIYSGLNGKSGDDFKQENNSLNRHYIPFTNIAKNRYINLQDVKNVLINKDEKQNKVKKGDLFFLMSSEGYEDIGKSSLLLDECNELYLNSFCKGFRLKNVNNIFINYLLSSLSFRYFMILGGKGFTRINLKIEKINDFKVLIPSLKEQTKIASYLDEKTQKIDSITKTIATKITLLKEFRKTLINDVVTGKVKVCD